VKADLSGNYGMPLTLSSAAQSLVNSAGVTGFPPSAQFYTLLFGPVVSTQFGRFRPFVHGLFGDNRVSSNLHVGIPGFRIPSITVSDTAFAMAFGGGVDVKVNERFSIRVGQGDYLFTKHDFSGLPPNQAQCCARVGIATHQNNFRVSAGIVFDLGGGSIPETHRVHVNRPLPVSPVIAIPSLGIAVVQHQEPGAEIVDIQPGSPADLAILHVGDVINSIDGRAISTPTELAAELANRAPGTQVRLGYLFHTSALGWFPKEIVVSLAGDRK
jgi:hypothetical protein